MTQREFIERVMEEFGGLPDLQGESDKSIEHLLEWNSLNLVIIIWLIVEEFGVRLTNKEVKSSDNLAELYDLILTKSQ
ncbi:MAG: acyl carrier protein [Bacteroidia bacterium]|jgi:acyl carrier protein